MLIECNECKAKVDAEVLSFHEHLHADIFSYRTYLLKCPSCNIALVGESEEIFNDGEKYWSDVTRVFPSPRRLIRYGIPEVVSNSINEAERCMQAGAFLATAAMCGRALEGICRHFKTKGSYLGPGLKELKEKGIIDARLFEWGEELREQRNKAAHATEEEMSAEDASDVLSFTYAIIDYVFLLALKFKRFQERKKERETGSNGKGTGKGT